MEISRQEYARAKGRLRRSEKVWKKYNPNPRGGMVLPGHVKDPASNEDRALVEVYEFQRRKRAAPYVGYFKAEPYPGRVTNWTGVTLGEVVRKNGSGVVVRGIDGNLYQGRSNGDGMFIRLRPKAAGRR